MNTFLVRESFPIAAKMLFVFVGDVLSGNVQAGMTFEVPEAGHRWPLVVKAVEMAQTVHGAKVALVVDDAQSDSGYLSGMGVGWTLDLRKPT
jgi:hypothetical protein